LRVDRHAPHAVVVAVEACAAARELNEQTRSIWDDDAGAELLFYCECGCYARRGRPALVPLTAAAYDELAGRLVLAGGHIRIATTW
jgi:hypothetical protein